MTPDVWWTWLRAAWTEVYATSPQWCDAHPTHRCGKDFALPGHLQSHPFRLAMCRRSLLSGSTRRCQPSRSPRGCIRPSALGVPERLKPEA